MLDAPGGASMNDSDAVERPLPSDAPARTFGSDRVADVLRVLDVPYVALNVRVLPGYGADMQAALTAALTKEAKPDRG